MKFKLITSIFFFLFAFTPLSFASETLPSEKPNEKNLRMIQLELEKDLRREINKDKKDLQNVILKELTSHRIYLQSLDDKIWGKIEFWFPIFATFSATVFAFFLWIISWQLGKTRKEAFENIQTSAIDKATELAQGKVSEILIPENIIKEAEEQRETTFREIKTLKELLVKEINEELISTRDEILKNRHDIINKTIDEAIKEKFSSEFDLQERLSSVENKLKHNEKLFGVFEDSIRRETIKQAVAEKFKEKNTSISLFKEIKEIPREMKNIQKTVEIISRLFT